MLILGITLRETAKLPSLWLHNFTHSPSIYMGSNMIYMRVPISPSLPILAPFAFFIIAILMVKRRCLIRALICFPYMTNNVEPISLTYWPFVYLLCRNVFSNSFAHFHIVLFVSLLLSYNICIFQILDLYQIDDL